MTNKQLKQFESETAAAWNRYFEASRVLKPWQFQERAALDAAYQQEYAAILAKWESMGEPPRISSASELALRAEKERLDRLAMEHYKRLIGEAQEEIARLQSGIAALREVLTQRRDDWQDRISREMAYQEPSPYAPYCLGYIDSLTATIKDLNALFPPDASASGNQRRNSDDNSGRK